MKKIKFEKKLSLKKESISHLNDEQLNKVNGGDGPFSWFCTRKCPTRDCTQADVTCDPAGCPTQGCFSAVYCA